MCLVSVIKVAYKRAPDWENLWADPTPRQLSGLEVPPLDSFSEQSRRGLFNQLLEQTVSRISYNCKLLVYIFGSLDHVHKLIVRGLQMSAPPKRRAKQLARYCSVSAIIDSRAFELYTACLVNMLACRLACMCVCNCDYQCLWNIGTCYLYRTDSICFLTVLFSMRT